MPLLHIGASEDEENCFEFGVNFGVYLYRSWYESYNESKIFCNQFNSTVYSSCGDDGWIAYEDKKCLRLFPTFTTRDHAVEVCNQHGSTLVIVGTAAKQMFLTE